MEDPEMTTDEVPEAAVVRWTRDRVADSAIGLGTVTTCYECGGLHGNMRPSLVGRNHAYVRPPRSASRPAGPAPQSGEYGSGYERTG
jgi:hypothetical protein